MRKIGAIVPIHGSEAFIKAFLKQCVYFDKVIFLINDKVWDDYVEEHYVDPVPDNTEEIILEYIKIHPNAELHHVTTSNYNKWKRVSDFWNPGLNYLGDCDIALKLDVDMFYTSQDWERMIKFIKETAYDSYVLDFSPKTVTNYYVTGSFEYGLDDSDGSQVVAFNVKYPIEHEMHPTGASCRLEENLPGIQMYHFRGWKPKYTKEWADSLQKNWIKDIPLEIKNYFI